MLVDSGISEEIKWEGKKGGEEKKINIDKKIITKKRGMHFYGDLK